MSKIFIATPYYEKPDENYYDSLIPGIEALKAAGHGVHREKFIGCCYVHTARNKLVQAFLNSDCDEMLFWDADIGVRTDELVRLCGHDKPIIGGAAPFRVGMFGFPVHPVVENGQIIPVDGLIKVDILPTALMKIQRNVFVKMIDAGKAPRRLETATPDKDDKPPEYRAFFDFEIAPVLGHGDEAFIEFGEDVAFCRKWVSMGGELWIVPDMTISHAGKCVREANYLHYITLMHEDAEKKKAAAVAEAPAISSAA